MRAILIMAALAAGLLLAGCTSTVSINAFCNRTGAAVSSGGTNAVNGTMTGGGSVDAEATLAKP